ncbi:MAG: metal ABC transporter ATP-binding protein [Thermoplasmata archaeon]|nr:metal ABC transporter ATP-binding protein [Thermoplasmata archaeon]
MEPVIEVENLEVKRGASTVVSEASFKIASGEYVGIVGPNGGGKTTLVEAVLGLLPKTKGTVKIFGRPIEDFDQWERIAYVPQHATNFDELFPLTVRELVAQGRIGRAKMGRKLRREDWEKVTEAMEFLEISHLAGKRIGKLSGGQKQRAFIARAIAREPEILVLDEPVAGVDPSVQEKFYKLLSDLNLKKGTTIISVSHDLSVVFCRMSRVICVNQRTYSCEVNEGTDPEKVLRQVYGEHFHFVFHRHECRGVFGNE